MTLPKVPNERGFTLIELIISLFILVLVIVGVLELFDLASKVSRVQVDTADMQQSLRMAQYDVLRLARMAGRGRVLAQDTGRVTPNGVAVSVNNNVPNGTFVDAPAAVHGVLTDTDVLTVRGVFTTPVYMADETSYTIIDPNPANTSNGGTFTVSNLYARLTQDLQPLADAINRGRPEALILVSPVNPDIQQIVMLEPAPASSVTTVAGVITQVTIRWRIGSPGHAFPTYAQAYLALSGNAWDNNLMRLGSVGILEEYKYYVSNERESAAPTAGLKPRLLRARVYPGTASPWGPGAPAGINDAANWAVPIADNVTDLQVAFGIDRGIGSTFTITDTGDNNDEWLFNDSADNPALPAWAAGRLRYLRISTTAIMERRDQKYIAPGFTGAAIEVEDHSYNIPEFGTGGNVPDRMFRRRTLQTLVDLRNL